MSHSIKILYVLTALYLGLSNTTMAQDNYGGHAIIFDPGDPIIYIDFASLYYSDTGTTGATQVHEVSLEQAQANLARMNTRASAEATRLAKNNTLTQFADEALELQSIVRSLLNDQKALREYRETLKAAGFDPDNLADTIAAYALSTYTLAQKGATGWGDARPQQMDAARASVRSGLSKVLPASVGADQLRAVLEETQTEHLLQIELARLSLAEMPTERNIIQNWLIDRAEDYAMMDVRATSLDDKKGFTSR